MEKPKRPVLVWGFDCLKQAIGTIIEHFASLLLSVILEDTKYDGCVWFIANYNLDLTVGLLFHYLFDKLILFVLKKIKKERDWWFLETGKYGNPPRVCVFILQSVIFSIIVILSKIIETVLLLVILKRPVLFLSNWCLSFLRSNRHVEIIIVMGIYPIIMSTLSFVVQDSLLKNDGSSGGGDAFSRLTANAEMGITNVLALTRKEGGGGKGTNYKKFDGNNNEKELESSTSLFEDDNT